VPLRRSDTLVRLIGGFKLFKASVLLALGYDGDTAACSLRLTVGVQTKPQDIDYTDKTLAAAINTLIRKPVEQAVVA